MNRKILPSAGFFVLGITKNNAPIVKFPLSYALYKKTTGRPHATESLFKFQRTNRTGF